MKSETNNSKDSISTREEKNKIEVSFDFNYNEMIYLTEESNFPKEEEFILKGFEIIEYKIRYYLNLIIQLNNIDFQNIEKKFLKIRKENNDKMIKKHNDEKLSKQSTDIISNRQLRMKEAEETYITEEYDNKDDERTQNTDNEPASKNILIAKLQDEQKKAFQLKEFLLKSRYFSIIDYGNSPKYRAISIFIKYSDKKFMELRRNISRIITNDYANIFKTSKFGSNILIIYLKASNAIRIIQRKILVQEYLKRFPDSKIFTMKDLVSTLNGYYKEDAMNKIKKQINSGNILKIKLPYLTKVNIKSVYRCINKNREIMSMNNDYEKGCCLKFDFPFISFHTFKNNNMLVYINDAKLVYKNLLYFDIILYEVGVDHIVVEKDDSITNDSSSFLETHISNNSNEDNGDYKNINYFDNDNSDKKTITCDNTHKITRNKEYSSNLAEEIKDNITITDNHNNNQTFNSCINEIMQNENNYNSEFTNSNFIISFTTSKSDYNINNNEKSYKNYNNSDTNSKKYYLNSKTKTLCYQTTNKIKTHRIRIKINDVNSILESVTNNPDEEKLYLIIENLSLNKNYLINHCYYIDEEHKETNLKNKEIKDNDEFREEYLENNNTSLRLDDLDYKNSFSKHVNINFNSYGKLSNWKYFSSFAYTSQQDNIFRSFNNEDLYAIDKILIVDYENLNEFNLLSHVTDDYKMCYDKEVSRILYNRIHTVKISYSGEVFIFNHYLNTLKSSSKENNILHSELDYSKFEFNSNNRNDYKVMNCLLVDNIIIVFTVNELLNKTNIFSIQFDKKSNSYYSNVFSALTDVFANKIKIKSEIIGLDYSKLSIDNRHNKDNDNTEYSNFIDTKRNKIKVFNLTITPENSNTDLLVKTIIPFELIK